MEHAYSALARLTEPAQSHAEPWRTFIAALVGVGLYLGLCSGFLILFSTVTRIDPHMDAGTPVALLVQLACIGLMGLAVGILVHVFHARRARTILGSWSRFRRDCWRTFVGVGLLLGIATILARAFAPEQIDSGLDFGAWLQLLPISLAVLLFQVLGEEMVFRGYLLQQIASCTRNPIWWIGLPSVLFGLAHLSHLDFGANALVVALWSGMFGIALADLTARTGSIGAAVGMHLANNVMALLVLSIPGRMEALALFVLPVSVDSPEFLIRVIPAEFLLVLLCWLTARLALRR